ncbi:hypothetical protein Tco_1460316, partial [Tanacetum coccineum]
GYPMVEKSKLDEDKEGKVIDLHTIVRPRATVAPATTLQNITLNSPHLTNLQKHHGNATHSDWTIKSRALMQWIGEQEKLKGQDGLLVSPHSKNTTSTKP